MRVGADGGGSGREESMGVLPDEGGAVALVQHVRLSDILVDAAAAGGQVGEGMVGPVVRAVVLGVGEWTGLAGSIDQFDDP